MTRTSSAVPAAIEPVSTFNACEQAAEVLALPPGRSERSATRQAETAGGAPRTPNLRIVGQRGGIGR